MSEPKKSFLIYFDNYPMLAALPPEQRGWLLSALMIYADRVWRDGTVSIEEIMEQFPQLSSEARLVCGFMGANVQRDTQRWMSRQRYQGQCGGGRKGSVIPVPESAERVEEDMARVRRLLEQEQGGPPTSSK